MMPVRKVFAKWIPLAIAVTCISGLIYLTIQQDLRQSANDPQIQLAEDAAGQLVSGRSTSEVLLPNQIEVNSSLAPFMIIYDKSGQVLGSSANLNGQTPVLPMGVFQSANQRGELRFTWQPNSSVRVAAVVVPVSSLQTNAGYVLAGRSLKEVERRESALTFQVAIAWGISLLISLSAIVLLDRLNLYAKRSSN